MGLHGIQHSIKIKGSLYTCAATREKNGSLCLSLVSEWFDDFYPKGETIHISTYKPGLALGKYETLIDVKGGYIKHVKYLIREGVLTDTGKKYRSGGKEYIIVEYPQKDLVTDAAAVEKESFLLACVAVLAAAFFLSIHDYAKYTSIPLAALMIYNFIRVIPLEKKMRNNSLYILHGLASLVIAVAAIVAGVEAWFPGIKF